MDYKSEAYKRYQIYDKKPWLLAEDFLGVKLNRYQKIYIYILHIYEKVKRYFNPYRRIISRR